MTVKEYLLSLLGFAPSNKDVVDGALIDAGITGSSTYDGSNTIEIKSAAVSVLKILLTTADVTQGTGETSNSIKYDRAAILKRISALENELGITSSLPTIKGLKVW